MQIDWWTLALQTVNFLIVVWLLSRFLYRPIRRVIEEREAADRKASEAAEEKVRAAEEARAAFEAKRAELAEVQRKEEARLHAEMEGERQAMLDAAEKKADALVADARAMTERDRKQALDDLREQIVALAGDLARKALGEATLPGDGLVERVSAHLDGLPETDLVELGAELADGVKALAVVTAAPLSDAERSRWSDALGIRFGKESLRFETDPGILGGVELRFPHAVLSFSVADRLKRAAKELREG